MSRIAVIEDLEQEMLKSDIPEFVVGDTITVHVRIKEGGKERIQAFTGTVIARRGTGISETFSLYRVQYGTAVERVFLLHSPNVTKIEVKRKGKTRRGKLYHIRGVFGKKARVQEKISARVKKSDKVKVAVEQAEEPKVEEAKAPEAEAPKPETPENNE